MDKEDFEKEFERRYAEATGEAIPQEDVGSYKDREWDSYREFVSACMKEEGGGKENMKLCAKHWRKIKGKPEPEDKPKPKSGAKTDSELAKMYEQAEGVYLITDTGCPGCKSAKAHMKKEIEKGLITVLNLQQSDKAVDMLMVLNLMAVPVMIVELDGEYCQLGAEGEFISCAPKE